MRVLISLLMLLSVEAFAYTGFGVCNLGNEKVDNVICYGPTVLKQTEVTGDVKIAGSLNADQVKLQKLVVSGQVDLKNSTVAGEAEIEGQLYAVASHFQQLTIRADSISLKNVSIDSALTVNSTVNKPLVKLWCGSNIKGSVVFEGATGTIQITDDSVIEGKIVNGQMEFIKQACN